MIEGFTQDYYDDKYFSDPKGKGFKRPDGSTEYWGYKNPTGEFLGAKPITEAWKTIFKPKNMLDIGCGRGTFLTYARDAGIEAYGFDYSEWAVKNRYSRCKKTWIKQHNATKPWPYKDGEFDLITALDFCEHIYEFDLPQVIEEMFRVASKWIFLQIATISFPKEFGYKLRKEERIPFEDGRTWAGHVTVQPESYWMDRFDREDWLLRRDMVHWFVSLVPREAIANWLKNTILVLEKVN